MQHTFLVLIRIRCLKCWAFSYVLKTFTVTRVLCCQSHFTPQDRPCNLSAYRATANMAFNVHEDPTITLYRLEHSQRNLPKLTYKFADLWVSFLSVYTGYSKKNSHTIVPKLYEFLV